MTRVFLSIGIKAMLDGTLAREAARERDREQRLEELLAQVAGVGRVAVMVTLSQSGEVHYAVDRNTTASSSTEKDAQGGTRTTTNETAQDRTLLVGDRALITRETTPAVAGVVIVAEGGGDVLVRDALTRAAATLAGVEVNRVQVLEMGGHQE